MGDEDDPVREKLHELANALTSARVWFVVLESALPKERDAQTATALAKVSRLLDDAVESCRQLRHLLP
jgi:hypothetical protein